MTSSERYSLLYTPHLSKCRTILSYCAEPPLEGYDDHMPRNCGSALRTSYGEPELVYAQKLYYLVAASSAILSFKRLRASSHTFKLALTPSL